MGHLRVDVLPRSRRWRAIVSDIAAFANNEIDIGSIVNNTSNAASSSFDRLQNDEVVLQTFTFLITLVVACRDPKPLEKLEELGINDSTHTLSPIRLRQALDSWIESVGIRSELGYLAQMAAGDSLANWYKENYNDLQLFEGSTKSADAWRAAADAAGFCEFSRIFFAKLTERHLRYYLEREASSVLNHPEDRDKFRDSLSSRIDDISRHAFETSKIMQSYAAGWFTKYALEEVPNKKLIKNFLSHSFDKIREEIRREGVK